MQPGESGIPWKYLWQDGVVETTFLSGKSPTTTTPSGVGVLLMDGGIDAYEFAFGGTGVVGDRFGVRIWRWHRLSLAAGDQYLPELALGADVTLGDDLWFTGRLLADGVRRWGGMGSRVLAHPGGPAMAAVAVLGATYLEVEVCLDTAASSDVAYRTIPVGLLDMRQAQRHQLDGTYA